MGALAFWKAVVQDQSRLIARFRDLKQEVPPELADRVEAVTDPEESE